MSDQAHTDTTFHTGRNPAAPSGNENQAADQSSLRQEIEQILEEQIRPVLKKHNGDIRISSLKKNILSVRLLGQCTRCASAALTFDHLVRETILAAVPTLRDVILDDSVPDDMAREDRKYVIFRTVCPT